MTDPGLEPLWKNVLERWDSDAAHRAFLDYCQAHDALVEAAVRYRGMTGDRERGPEAERRLKGVTVLALARLEAARTPPSGARREASRILLGVLFLATSLVLLWYLLER